MGLRDFGWPELWFLLFSARWTMLLSLIAFLGGGALGLVVAVLRVARSRLVRAAAAVWIRVLQGTPLLVQLLVVYYGTSFVGLHPDAWIAAAIAFVVGSSAFFGEIWRGCIEAIPRGQWESATALGLRFVPTLRLVVLPQALRLMLAPTIGYMVQIVKSTSIASLIGIAELTRTAVLVNTVTFEPVKVFGTVTLTYFAMCWPLSLLAAYVARRLDARHGRSVAELLRRRPQPRPRVRPDALPGMAGLQHQTHS